MMPIRRFLLLLAVGLGIALSGIGVAADAPPEPDGYRQSEYRAPVPATLQGARVIDPKRAEALWREKRAVFVDVLPRAPKPAKLPESTVWRDPPREDIPGSIWLADTGFGTLAPEMERYFLDGLAEATGGDRTRTLVFYCLKSCWMSWNAAKRAMGAGYSDVVWFPDGTDGWSHLGLPLESRTPVPRPSQQAE